MATISRGDLTVQCEDGRMRFCPFGLADELDRVFGAKPDAKDLAKGAVFKFANGVRIRFMDAKPEVPVFDLADYPHVILCGADKGKEQMPPFVEMPSRSVKDEPIPSIVQVIDTTLRMPGRDEERDWVIKWPNFDPWNGRRVVKALLDLKNIPVRLRFKPVGTGRWHLYRNGRDSKWKRHVPPKTRVLTGSKYPWAELLPGEPVVVTDTTIPAVQNNFYSWAGRRGIGWRIMTKTLAPGIIMVTREGMTDTVGNKEKG